MTLYSMALVLLAAGWLTGSLPSGLALPMAVLIGLLLVTSRGLAGGVR